MDAAELLERVRHYRSLAERADEQIRGELLYLGEQYERWARDLEQRGAPTMTAPRDGLTTARNTLPKDAWLLWCKACFRPICRPLSTHGRATGR
jgi:hypothetical protein